MYRILGNFHVGIFLRIGQIVVFVNINFVNLHHVSTYLQLLPFDHTLNTFSHPCTRRWKRCSKYTPVFEDTTFIKRYGCAMEKKFCCADKKWETYMIHMLFLWFMNLGLLLAMFCEKYQQYVACFVTRGLH